MRKINDKHGSLVSHGSETFEKGKDCGGYTSLTGRYGFLLAICIAKTRTKDIKNVGGIVSSDLEDTAARDTGSHVLRQKISE